MRLTRPSHNVYPPKHAVFLPKPKRLTYAFIFRPLEEADKALDGLNKFSSTLNLRGRVLSLNVSVESWYERAVNVI